MHVICQAIHNQLVMTGRKHTEVGS